MKLKAIIGIVLILVNTLFFAFRIAPAGAGPGIINVPGDYLTIQAAVNAAGLGDTILVAAGRYNETVFVDKSLTLIGEGSITTFIDGFSQAGSVVKVNASNVKISGFTVGNGTQNGIELVYSSNCTISGNTITKNHGSGVFLNHSSTNNVSDNVISNNGYCGIYLREYSSNNVVSKNRVSESLWYGILLYYSSNNVIGENAISGMGVPATDAGIRVWMYSKNNIVSNNTVSNHTLGIFIVEHASSNVVSGNTLSDNSYGIKIWSSEGNIVRENNMTNNVRNFDIIADSLREYIQDIDASNTVDGKPIYYWVNQYSKQVPAEAGYVAVINSTNIVVKDLNISKNGQGVLLAYSSNSTVTNVNVSNNEMGVYLYGSKDNSVFGNTVLSNNEYGIRLQESSGNVIFYNSISYSGFGIHLYFMCNNNSINRNIIANNSVGIELITASSNNSINGNIVANSSRGMELSYAGGNFITGNTVTTNDYGVFSEWCNNTFYHNNFINNLRQVNVSVSVNVWDNGYPSGGNYWSDYVGVDDYSGVDQNEVGSDGIGDAPYLMGQGNQDNYPLMAPIVVDQIVVSDDRCDVGSIQTVSFHAGWTQYDLFNATFYVDGDKYVTNSTGWISFNVTYDAVGKRVWFIAVSNSCWIIWDRIKIVDGGVSRAHANVTETETVWFKAVYEYDGVVFDGLLGTLYVNGSAMMWSNENERWEYNFSFDTAGTRIFHVSGVSDSQYGLTALNDAVGVLAITWWEVEAVPFWKQWWFWAVMVAAVMVVIAIYLIKTKKLGGSRRR